MRAGGDGDSTLLFVVFVSCDRRLRVLFDVRERIFASCHFSHILANAKMLALLVSCRTRAPNDRTQMRAQVYARARASERALTLYNDEDANGQHLAMAAAYESAQAPSKRARARLVLRVARLSPSSSSPHRNVRSSCFGRLHTGAHLHAIAIYRALVFSESIAD